MAFEFFMRKMTDGMESGIIVGWLADEGSRVEKGQPILEIETDKATIELDSPTTGILKGIRPGVEAGAKVPVGMTIAYIADLDEEVPALASLSSFDEPEKAGPKVAPPSQDQSAPGSGSIRATPDVRRFAREKGVQLSEVRGSGPDGRITKEDVILFLEKENNGDWLVLSNAQQVTGERMLESIQTAPQFALTCRADMTHVLEFRNNRTDKLLDDGSRISITAILVKIVAGVLRHFPRANASFIEGRIKVHQQINIGVALGTDAGLFVPVVSEADSKSLATIAEEIKTFQEKVVESRLDLDDLSGGTFTISNLGMFGVEQFNAIINPPQSAILAVGAVVKTPVVMPDDSISIRPQMALTLSIDHRCMDGLQGAAALSEIRKAIEQFDPSNIE